MAEFPLQSFDLRCCRLSVRAAYCFEFWLFLFLIDGCSVTVSGLYEVTIARGEPQMNFGLHACRSTRRKPREVCAGTAPSSHIPKACCSPPPAFGGGPCQEGLSRRLCGNPQPHPRRAPGPVPLTPNGAVAQQPKSHDGGQKRGSRSAAGVSKLFFFFCVCFQNT